MSKVIFLSTTKEGQKESGSVSFVGKKYTVEGIAVGMIRDWKKEGILGKDRKPFMMSDGELFMENLKYQYSGSYLRATEVLMN